MTDLHKITHDEAGDITLERTVAGIEIAQNGEGVWVHQDSVIPLVKALLGALGWEVEYVPPTVGNPEMLISKRYREIEEPT